MPKYRYLLVNLKAPVKRNIDLKSIILDRYYFLSKIWDQNEISYTIIRQSIDARKRNQLFYNFSAVLESVHPLKLKDALEYHDPESELLPVVSLSEESPFIIGMGPAGLFAALELAERGFKPWIFDRGDPVEKRTEKVNLFWKEGKLDTESNVQYGEGGAGTFSDGKLTARNRTIYSEKVYRYLIQFGANPSIQTESLPHLGTDGLKKILIKMRSYLEEKGCRFFFRHKLEAVKLDNNRVKEVIINGQVYQPEMILLAPGNSARDTFLQLHAQGLALENKPFAVGFRIEHSQDFINDSFFGKDNDFSLTGPAVYNLTAKADHYGVYSFCMCPGGFVIPASSESDGQVVNGMSFLNRANRLANSAIVVTVNEQDYGKTLFDGMKFQIKTEKKGFRNFSAPVQNAEDYIRNRFSKNIPAHSYSLDVYKEDLNNLLPSALNKALKTGLLSFEKRIRDFTRKGLLIGAETRTSCPIRIVRDHENRCSVSAENLYPVGEGSGYAGGIISSAADGLKTAMLFTHSHQNRK